MHRIFGCDVYHGRLPGLCSADQHATHRLLCRQQIFTISITLFSVKGRQTPNALQFASNIPSITTIDALVAKHLPESQLEQH